MQGLINVQATISEQKEPKARLRREQQINEIYLSQAGNNKPQISPQLAHTDANRLVFYRVLLRVEV